MAAEPVTEKQSSELTAPAAPVPAPGKPRRPSRAGFLRRLGIGFNVIIQLVLALALLLFVNGYAYKHFHRFDYTRDHKYALSDRTKNFLRGLDKQVKVIVLMNSRSLIAGDVNNLVEEYRNVQGKYISLDLVDSFRAYTHAVDIQTKYKLGPRENVVILDCDGRTKILGEDKLAAIDPGNELYNQPPQVLAFTGEQAITAGLIEVAEGKKSTVYYVQGHGEPSLAKGKVLEPVADLLAAEHLTLAELNTVNADAVPKDATVLMLLGPQFDLTDREIQLLTDYWDKGGRLLVLLNPDFPTPHLASFLSRQGVRPDDDRVLYMVKALDVTRIRVGAIAFFAGDSTIAVRLVSVTPEFKGSTQSLTLTPESGAAMGLKIGPLLVAFEGHWGETAYKEMETHGASNDPSKDKQGPLVIAATVEKGGVGDQRMQVTPSRMVVIGNSRFVDPELMTEPLYALFVSSVNWLGEREALIGVPPKPVQLLAMNISEANTLEMRRILLGYMPGACALLGFLVWWWRRRS